MLRGIDGCRGGWVVATSDQWPSFTLTIVQSVQEAFVDSDIVAIDVPIGLPRVGPRACDLEARRRLGPRQGSRVFPAPCRAALAGNTYNECCELNFTVCGKKLSKQAHAILAKIREVDSVMT